MRGKEVVGGQVSEKGDDSQNELQSSFSLPVEEQCEWGDVVKKDPPPPLAWKRNLPCLVSGAAKPSTLGTVDRKKREAAVTNGGKAGNSGRMGGWHPSPCSLVDILEVETATWRRLLQGLAWE